MKKVFLLTLLIAGCCKPTPTNNKIAGTYVEVTYHKDFGDLCDNTGEGCLMVYTWYNDDLVDAKYLNPNTVTDSMITIDSLQGIETIKKLNKHLK